MLGFANRVIEGTEYALKYRNGLDMNWWRWFLKKYKDSIGEDVFKSLEVDREMWTTSANLEVYYERMKELLLSCPNGAIPLAQQG